MVRQTIIEDTPTEPVAVQRVESASPIANTIYVLFGLLEVVLAFRFVLLLLGADRASGFVAFIYALSTPFVAPFYGIFPNAAYGGSYFDPATLVAILVYAVVAWAIIRLVVGSTRRVV